ncbi:DUF4247 domain-containing protein [Cohnella faecalis]|uniref:DUF4247 domain-containing protein n=2 Tax=Cohnella faecalis TaxID=2315694 RepID=A0A398CI19_9BACL|nr:DUF4247 domain-containing protein [Cohnella faecalis]RIE01985.1 DUF4247 domain-containing protein [Cohnella faecalis]
MSSRLSRWASAIHLSVVLALMVTLLSACGSLKVEETYPLESVNGSGSQTSYVYRAAGVTVQEAAKELVEQKKPEQQSKADPDHMFLVYSDQVIHVQKDENKPEDSLVEVDSKEYFRQNYSPSFLEGYLLANLIGSLFDGGPRSGGYGDYRGYGSMGSNPPATGKYHAPSAAEKKAAPPVTVEKKGSIFKRSKTGDDGSSVGSNGLFGKKSSSSSSSSSGKITREDGSGSSKKSSGYFTPRKKSAPRTKSGGFGRISKRR